MSRIFLSYRRGDTSGHAGRLYDHLCQKFGEEQVFFDLDAIEPGEDFVARIEHVIATCDLVLVLIGRDWLSEDETGRRRLDHPRDFVRLEIAAALRRSVRLIPVLVQGVFMPSPEDLPDDIRSLTRRNAVELSDGRWGYDTGRLLKAVESTVQAELLQEGVDEELAPGSTFAGYRVESLAGRGGMATVYRATHLALNRVDALKLIAPEVARDPVFRERFRQEVELAASIEHENVVSVYDAGEEKGRLYLAMEYVAGSTLANILAKEGPLHPPRAVAIAGQVAAGLQAAHALGLVHRDVKPSNILIEARDSVEHVYLADFGIARRTAGASNLTRTGAWVGTADYVAPEQVMDEDLDPRADIYALGCVVFEMLTGGAPFGGKSDTAKLVAHVSEAPPELTSLRAELPPKLDAVVRRAMAKKPAARYRSADQFAKALRTAVRGADAPPRRAARKPPTTPVREQETVTGESAGVRLPAAARASPAKVSAPAARRAEAQPEQTPSRTRRREPTRATRPRLSTRAVGVAALIAIGGVGAGFGIGKAVDSGGGQGRTPPASPASQAVRAGVVSLAIPADWTRSALPPAVPGLEFSEAAAFGPAGEADRGLVVGEVEAGPPTFLPGSFLERLPEGAAEAREVVVAGDVEGYRYSALAPNGFPGSVTAFAVPTTERTVVAACLASGTAGKLAECESVVATMSLNGADPLPLRPSAEYAAALSTVSSELAGGLRAADAELGAATSADAQGAAASRAADAYAAASDQLAGLDPPKVLGGAHGAIVQALDQLRRDYRKLASAARNDNSGVYGDAAASIDTHTRELNTAIAALSEFGYTIVPPG